MLFQTSCVQKCATCSFWSGSRRVTNNLCNMVEADGMGACYHPTSASKNSNNKRCVDTCPKFNKWNVLK